MKPVLRTGAGERHRFALLPLCALLASLPFATLAQEAALQPVTVKASKAAVQPAAVSEVPADQIEANRTRTSDTAHLLSGLPGSTPVAIIQHASLPHQRHALTFLKDLPQCIADNGLGSPSIIVVGDVVQGVAAWQEKQGQCHVA